MTATLIVRDEAAVLPRCLASLSGVADDIVVVDTGSKDDSPDIAARFGARVVHFDWQNDFSAARNFALTHARGEWILYIDADERVQPLSRERLSSLLDDQRAIAATVKFRCRTGFTRYRECRLFRNDPRIRFRNVIHETMLEDVEAVIESDGLRLAASDLAIDHFGYDGTQAHKHTRNIPLLRARLARDPDHVYSWNHLGQALAGLGDMAGAADAWQHAIEIVRTAGARSALDALPYGSLLTSRHAAADRYLLDEALERFPDDCLFRWLRGRHLLDERKFADALVYLESLTGVDPETFCSDDGIAYDVRIFGAPTYEAAALCHFRLGHYEESARLYEIAAILDPENPGSRVRQRLSVSRAASNSSQNEESDAIGR